MSSKDNFARHKSARWARATTANYDGDDWSDDDEAYGKEEYDNNKTPQVPKIPDQYVQGGQKEPGVEGDDDTNSFSENAETPAINVQQKFDSIDLDDAENVQGLKDTGSGGGFSVTSDSTNGYTELIRDQEESSDDGHEYRPQQQTRFEPIVPDKSSIGQQNDPASFPQDHQKPENRAIPDVAANHYEQSSFEAPESEHATVSDSGYIEKEPKPVSYQFHEQPYSEDESIVDSEVNDYDEGSHESQPNHQFLSQEGEENSTLDTKTNTNNDEYINAVPLSDSEDDDDYRIHKVDTGFQNFKDNDDSEEHYVQQEEPLSKPEVPIISVENEQPVVTEYEGSEHSPIVLGTSPDHVDNDSSLAQKSSINTSAQVPKNSLSINTPLPAQEIPPPQESPNRFDLSDADTLHIHDPNESSDDESSSIQEIPRIESSKSLHQGDDLKEHAYLGSLINSPNPDEDYESFRPEDNGTVFSDGSFVHQGEQPRDSKFYSSVTDYFDDYQEDEEENPRLSKIASTSSGSLSTGGPSIKSEGAYRFSKISDRSASFTNRSLVPSEEIQSINEFSEPGEESREPSSLNPAMSINFGQWRPNTESFRDQFILGSGTTGTLPPMPKLDSYTRNSRGEIVEDVSSINESLQNTSLNPVESGDEVHSFEPKEVSRDQAYRTESDSLIPLHIRLDSGFESKDTSEGQFYKEKISAPSAIDNVKENQIRVKKNYNMKQIAGIDNSKTRIYKYREAREEEANIETGLKDWISYALETVEVVPYKSNVSTNHVKQAYAEAANSSQSGRKHNNLGSILHKSRVFHDTSNSAQSFAKGIFSRGRKIIKNDK